MRRYRIALYIAAGLGVVIGSLNLYVGFQHNAQGELFDWDTGEVDFRFALLIFGSWAVITTLVVGAVLCAFVFLAGKLRRHEHRLLKSR